MDPDRVKIDTFEAAAVAVFRRLSYHHLRLSPNLRYLRRWDLVFN